VLGAGISGTTPILDLTNAHKAFKSFIHHQNKCVTVEMIQKRVGWYFGVFPPDLKLRGGSKAAGRHTDVDLDRTICKLTDSLT
jgi:chromosomal replication initiation ATPase DnaA